MPNMAALTSATTLTTISSSAYNTNLTTIRDWANTYAVMKDVAATISVGHTFTATQTFTPGSGAAFTVTTGGITITAGGITVSAGGVTVTGNSTITGTLNVTSTLSQGGVAVVTGTGTSGRMTRWTGTGVVANSAASDDGTFVTCATQPCVRATSSGPVSIANGANGNLTWVSPPLNVGTMWAAGNTDRFTVPANAGGTYLCIATVRLPDNGTTQASAFTVTWATSAGATTGNSLAPGTSGGLGGSDLVFTVSTVFQAAAGDYFTVQITNNSGAVLSNPAGIATVVKLW